MSIDPERPSARILDTPVISDGVPQENTRKLGVGNVWDPGNPDPPPPYVEKLHKMKIKALQNKREKKCKTLNNSENKNFNYRVKHGKEIF